MARKSSLIYVRSDIIHHEINREKRRERERDALNHSWHIERGNKEESPILYSRSIHGLRTVEGRSRVSLCVEEKKKKKDTKRLEEKRDSTEGIKKKKRKGRRAFHPIFQGGSDRRSARCPRGRPRGRKEGEGGRSSPRCLPKGRWRTVKQKPGL